MPAGDSNYTNVVASAAVVSDSVLQDLSGDGTVGWPSSPGIPKVVILRKGSAAAITLTTPVAGGYGTGDDGKVIWFFSETAFAHQITSGQGFNRKGSSGTATASAAANNQLCVTARNGQVNVLSNTNFTLA